LAQLEHIEAIERRLWSAADTLRANSSLASNEYFLPVMGLVFLRHAYSRYLTVKAQIEPTLPSRGGVVRALNRKDFSQRNAIFLRPEAQFDHLVALPESADRVQAVIDAMVGIEQDYPTLQEVLPKDEYRQIGDEVLGNLLRQLKLEELEQVSGDVFGRIYEYFLTQFADQHAHDNGEFYTPVSLVSLIAHVLDPQGGIVLDPACGSGGMFVQSARMVEEQGARPSERLTFYGMEKNPTTLRLGKMNLAVHGLEGNIQQANTYYEDPHELVGKADYLLANPPFNVDEIDASKIKRDPRLPFGLPGVNKKGLVSNGNYVWISYFYAYLNAQGRAGFVMSSQASSAGRKEAAVRQKLIESGDVELMVAIRSNFFYTRTVPCELWFLNRAKTEAQRDQLLMIDARAVYRQVTRKICDFSPEQAANLLATVWLYRGEQGRYLELLERYIDSALQALPDLAPLQAYGQALEALCGLMAPFVETLPAEGEARAAWSKLRQARKTMAADAKTLAADLTREREAWAGQARDNEGLVASVARLEAVADAAQALRKGCEALYRQATGLISCCEREHRAKRHDAWATSEIGGARRAAEAALAAAVAPLEALRYGWEQPRWLTERFPEGRLQDVPGLVKVVTRAELAQNDWSLTPGRYVGVAPEPVDPDFDFEATMRQIHDELAELNAEATELAERIQENLRELGI